MGENLLFFLFLLPPQMSSLALGRREKKSLGKKNILPETEFLMTSLFLLPFLANPWAAAETTPARPLASNTEERTDGQFPFGELPCT